ncbi:hypothetical protein [Dickeya undicola]|uniref:hypothetical protein n=1 Tax=Dickeya undicola TaxID=1577887 RepID=UPI0011CEB3D8|nr:hypothetical protein [Dickeya undicola]
MADNTSRESDHAIKVDNVLTTNNVLTQAGNLLTQKAMLTCGTQQAGHHHTRHDYHRQPSGG